MTIRATYTFAKLEVSQLIYDEIRSKLAEAGYEHAFGMDDDVELIDMHGIALVRSVEPFFPKQCKRSLGRKGRCPATAVNEVETVFRTVYHPESMSYWTPVCAHHSPPDRNVRRIAEATA